MLEEFPGVALLRGAIFGTCSTIGGRPQEIQRGGSDAIFGEKWEL